MALPRVKVSAIVDLAEAHAATAAGVAVLGFVDASDGGPPGLTDARIGELAALVPPGIASFLSTSSTDIEVVLEKQRHTHLPVVELNAQLPMVELRMLRALSPGVRLVQCVRIDGSESVADALSLAHEVDGLLLELDAAGSRGRHVKRVLHAARRVCEGAAVPIWTRAATIDQALELVDVVAPFGIDVTAGVRVGGRLVPESLHALMAALAEGASRAAAQPRQASGA